MKFLAGLLLAGSAFAATTSVEKERPVMKVVRLLQDMKEELEAAVSDDAEVHKMLDCWCTTNEKEKTTCIKLAGEQIEQLKTDIEEYLSNEKRLMTEIADLEEEIDKNQKALDSATAIRRKEVAAMNSNEKDLIKYIRALKSAIISLKKHHSLVQMGSMMFF
jgi:chromosome segregation ATPase